MRLDRLTTKTREALSQAQSDATAKGHPELVPEHLLSALLRQDGGATALEMSVADSRERGNQPSRQLPSFIGAS